MILKIIPTILHIMSVCKKQNEFTYVETAKSFKELSHLTHCCAHGFVEDDVITFGSIDSTNLWF